jgi:hypothetical protein
LRERVVVTPTLIVFCGEPAERIMIFGSLDDRAALAHRLRLSTGAHG